MEYIIINAIIIGMLQINANIFLFSLSAVKDGMSLRFFLRIKKKTVGGVRKQRSPTVFNLIEKTIFFYRNNDEERE